MEIKRYSKKELACRYFPDASEPKVALNHLRSWINGCPELMEQLGRVRLHRTRNHYNEEEVALIVDYLGQPEDNGEGNGTVWYETV